MSWPIDEEDQDDDDMPALRDDESEVDDQEEDLETMPGLHSLGNVSEEVINDYNADQARNDKLDRSPNSLWTLRISIAVRSLRQSRNSSQ